MVPAVTGVVVAQAPVLDPVTPHLSMRLLRREVRLHPRLARMLARRFDPHRWTGLLLTEALGALGVASAAIGILLLMVYEAAGLARSHGLGGEKGLKRLDHPAWHGIEPSAHGVGSGVPRLSPGGVATGVGSSGANTSVANQASRHTCLPRTRARSAQPPPGDRG